MRGKNSFVPCPSIAARSDEAEADPVEQRPAFALGGETPQQFFEYLPFGFLIERRVRAAFASQPRGNAVHQRPKRLHQIIGQAEGVVAVVMVDSERRMKTRAAQRPCGNRAKHGVTIIEAGIQPLAFRIAAKVVFAKKSPPVNARAL